MADTQHSDQPGLRLGVSACLLGKPVRFDGGHKRDSFLTEALAHFVQWVPVCPKKRLAWGYHASQCGSRCTSAAAINRQTAGV